MKNNLFKLTTALFISSTVLLGCKKQDGSPPVVYLVGEATDTISLQGSYLELGAIAEDLYQEGITPIPSGTVDVNLKGTYIITYTASDEAGNIGTNKRKVTVINDVDYAEGTYYCSIAGTVTWNYEQLITASKTVNNRINFGKFADHNRNTSIYADVNDTILTISSQTALQIGTPSYDRTFEGIGTINKTRITLGYNETANAVTIATNESCVKK